MKKELTNLPAGDERVLKITEWVLFLSLILILIYQIVNFNDSDFFAPTKDDSKPSTLLPVQQVNSDAK